MPPKAYIYIYMELLESLFTSNTVQVQVLTGAQRHFYPVYIVLTKFCYLRHQRFPRILVLNINHYDLETGDLKPCASGLLAGY
jgi:hypothetical protein